MRTLRAFFLGRLLREKVLLVLFIMLGALMWASNYGRRAAADWRGIRAVTAELAEQREWLRNREEIEAASVRAVQNLDPSRTLDDTRLVGELNALAREYNLNFTNDTPQTQRSGQFAVHTVQITLQRADWGTLRRFYEAIARRSPYIGIEQFALRAEPSNPANLTASVRISSVEIVR
jgi:hypothetical protein